MAEIRINATGGVKLYDADDSHYAQIVAGTITSNVDAITLGHDTVTIADNLSLGSDSAVLKFGADGDTTLTHTDGTGLTLNSTNKICFNDASQFIQGSSGTVLSIGATDEIDLTATAVDLNGTLNVSGVATFQANPVFPDGGVAIADLDIDGGTDIGAAIVDADLFIIDDGAGGTNRKTTASRLKTYAGYDSTPAFYAFLGSNQTITNEATTTIICGTETFDTDSAYNASNGLFTVPSGESGTYVFYFGAVMSNTFDNDDRVMCKLLVNGSAGGAAGRIVHQEFTLASTYQYQSALSGVVPLDVGDTVAFAIESFDDAGTNTALTDDVYFAGFKITSTNS